MIFTNPQPSNNFLKWYNKSFNYGEVSDLHKTSQVDSLLAHTKGDTLFDIGAWDGTFLHAARNKGYKVSGIEPSKTGVNMAKRKYGIKIINGFFDEKFVGSFNKKFDVVTILHVLEHVQSPVNFIRHAMRITKPNKYIFIEVPDTSRPFAGNIADYFSIEHIMHFTEGSLINIASKLGLKVIRTDKLRVIPAIRILLKYCKNPATANKPKLKNEYLRNKRIVNEYTNAKKRFLLQLKRKINLPGTIILFGAGMHTSQLMQTGLLENVKINSIIDSSPKKHGTLFEGCKVRSPEILKSKRFPVLISSYDSQEEISDYLSANFPHIQQIKMYNMRKRA